MVDQPHPALGPLREVSFFWLWLGQSLSAVGDGIFYLALPVFLLQGSRPSTDFGFVLAAQSLALTIFVLVGGLIADRFRRTVLMAIADVLRAGAVAALMLVPHTAPLGILMAFTAVVGTGEAIFYPAYRALIPSLVPESQLQSANAVMTTSSRAARIIGPALGGIIVAVSGVAAAFAVDAATFLLSVSTLIGLSRSDPRRAQSAVATRVIHDALAGVRELRRRPWVAAIIGQGTLQVFLVHAPLAVLIPLYLRSQHELDYLGLMYSAQGVGAVAGAILAVKIRPKEPGTVALLVLLLDLLPLSAMLMHAPSASLAAAMAIGGVGGAVFSVFWATALQAAIPSEVMGRVASLDYLGQLGLDPAGVAVTPPLVRVIGFKAVAIVCAASLLVTTVLPFCVPGVRRLRGPGAALESEPVDGAKRR